MAIRVVLLVRNAQGHVLYGLQANDPYGWKPPMAEVEVDSPVGTAKQAVIKVLVKEFGINLAIIPGRRWWYQDDGQKYVVYESVRYITGEVPERTEFYEQFAWLAPGDDRHEQLARLTAGYWRGRFDEDAWRANPGLDSDWWRAYRCGALKPLQPWLASTS